MKKILLFFVLGAGIAGVSWFISQKQPFTEQPRALLDEVVESTQTVAQVITPGPLRARTEVPRAKLTREGVFSFTNKARTTNGNLTKLTLNTDLNSAAEAKLQDMFDQQYFDHVSPDGKGPSDVVAAAQYQYIVVGENLAQGNFENDQALVDAWMASPGHRANILNTSYLEIGIAVGQGMYEGHQTWLAVQEFGKPKSACPAPDEALGRSIDRDRDRLEILKTQADTLKQELDESKPQTREEVEAHNAKVNEYNVVVNKLNSLIEKIKTAVANYNRGVQIFNACAGS